MLTRCQPGLAWIVISVRRSLLESPAVETGASDWPPVSELSTFATTKLLLPRRRLVKTHPYEAEAGLGVTCSLIAPTHKQCRTVRSDQWLLTSGDEAPAPFEVQNGVVLPVSRDRPPVAVLERRNKAGSRHASNHCWSE